MKQLLRKIFFWDEPAKGAFWAITCLFVGNSLWFTLYQLLWLSDCGLVRFNFMSEHFEREVQMWAVGHLVIVFYALTVFLRALWLLFKKCRKKCDYRPILYVGASIIEWLCTAFFCIVPLFYLLHVLSHYGEPFSILPDWMSMFEGIQPHGWWKGYLIAVMCMVVGGFFIVRTFVQAEQKKLHDAVSKIGAAFWCVFWIAYIVLLGMAMAQSRRMVQTRIMVEQRFGYPLSAEGVWDYYQKQGTIDKDFWKRLKDNLDKLPSELTIGEEVEKYWDGKLPEPLTAEHISDFEKYCKANETALIEAEKCFDSVPPLPSYDFIPGNLPSLVFDFATPCRRFMKLELSRLRVFLKKHDKDNALNAYQRIGNCAQHMQCEFFVIGSLVWLNTENMRLDAMEKLLESRLLTDDELKRLDNDLTSLEERIPINHNQAMFTEAAFGQDVIWGLETGETEDTKVAFADLRWFYPQLWLQATLDKNNLLRQYLVKDFADFCSDPVPLAYVFSSMLHPVLKPVGNKFHGLTARVLAMKTLLRAEMYRREHGDFPENMTDMPIDPFSGKPMLYRYGIVELPEVIRPKDAVQEDWDESPDWKTPQLRKAKAVQVWSVGVNGKDDGGVMQVFGGKDDPCARIRLE